MWTDVHETCTYHAYTAVTVKHYEHTRVTRRGVTEIFRVAFGPRVVSRQNDIVTTRRVIIRVRVIIMELLRPLCGY